MIFSGRKKSEQDRKKAASVSVFLALILAVMITFIFTAVESVRIKAAQTYLTIAANSAVDSLFSQYHLELWDQYRLLGLEMYAPEEVTAEYYSFLHPYLDDAKTTNWYCLGAEEKDIDVEDYKLLTDENGAVFEEQVKAYMSYGIALELLGVETAEESLQQTKTAEQTAEYSGELEKSSRTARNFNRKLEALAKAVKEHNNQMQSVSSAFSSGEGVIGALKVLKVKAEKVQSLISEVEGKADELATEISGTRQKLEMKKASGELTEEAFSQLDAQLENYETYSLETGEKKQELEQLKTAAEDNLSVLETVLEEAENAQEYIRSWTPGQILVGYKPAEKPGEKPEPIYEDEVLDRAAVWREARENFEAYEKLTFVSGIGEIDEEKSDQLDRLSDLLKGNLLEVVFPDTEKLSREKLDLEEAPSSLYLEEKTNLFSSGDYLLTKLAIDEYAVMELSNAKKEASDSGEESEERQEEAGKTEAENTKAAPEKKKESGELSSAELEYVICGKESDYENVAELAKELVLLRTGSNLLYLMKDSDSMKLSGAVAEAVTGCIPGNPLTLIAQSAILLVWANAQALIDAKELFAGGRVPLMHNASSFTLDLEALLQNPTGVLKKAGKGISETGQDYEAYLRMLLATRSLSECDYRIMDMIQKNLREEQPDFRVDRLYTKANIHVEAKSEVLFTRWKEGFLEGLRKNSEYSLSADTCYSY